MLKHLLVLSPLALMLAPISMAGVTTYDGGNPKDIGEFISIGGSDGTAVIGSSSTVCAADAVSPHVQFQLGYDGNGAGIISNDDA